jgi:hypothetical protein
MRNKKILALGITLLLFVLVAGMAFAIIEYEYTIEVYFNDSANNLQKAKYTLWAASAEDARDQAIALCTREKGTVASCGDARVTGRTRGN